MDTKKGYFLVFLTALISGFAIFINRFGVKGFNPYIFTGLKNLAVALLLSSLLLILKDWKILKELNKKQWIFLLLIGLIGGSIPFLLFFKGLSLTIAAKAAFIHKTMFLYVAVFATFFLKEKIDKKFLFGGLLLILGNLLFVQKLSPGINQGDFLIFLATLFWAGENTLSKYVLRELPGRIVAWGRMFFGSLFIFAFLLLSGQLFLLSHLNLPQIEWVIITSIVLFGYVITWYSGLKYIPVSRATVILLLGSPITTFLSFLQTGKVTYQNILASLLVIFGVVFVLGIKEVWELIKGLKYARA